MTKFICEYLPQLHRNIVYFRAGISKNPSTNDPPCSNGRGYFAWGFKLNVQIRDHENHGPLDSYLKHRVSQKHDQVLDTESDVLNFLISKIKTGK